MTAAVIVLLAQEGKLSLDDPVSKYVPGVPDGDNITITELLNMRSGLYTYDDDPEFWAILERDPAKVWTPAEVLMIAFKHPPYFPPGTGFHYSNTNYALLGLIAEKIDGKPLASCFQDRLFGPLGLKDTLLPATDSNTLPDPYSHGYLYGGCSFSNLTDKPYPPDIQARPGPEPSSPTTAPARTLPTPRRLEASSRPPTISPHGSRHWSVVRCSTPTINASGSTACSPRCRASPRAKSMGTASAKLAGDRTRFIFTAARYPASTRKSATTQPTS
jgi:CubicO group peptidase (beta-lactamase class C family)